MSGSSFDMDIERFLQEQEPDKRVSWYARIDPATLSLVVTANIEVLARFTVPLSSADKTKALVEHNAPMWREMIGEYTAEIDGVIERQAAKYGAKVRR